MLRGEAPRGEAPRGRRAPGHTTPAGLDVPSPAGISQLEKNPYGATFSMITLPVPATVPRPFSKDTSPNS